MCRFTAYFGNEVILLDKLLEHPINSLIKQSRESRELQRGVNADGFGLAWYSDDIEDDKPGIFKSIKPAWNDHNLMHLSQKIKSSRFLAHVRSATVGDVNNNCHPFAFKEYSLVHNGTIRGFNNYKRELINTLDNDLFLSIKGNTDSEYFFFSIMQFLKKNNTLKESVQKAIHWVVDSQKNDNDFCRINIVITDGKELMATRFVSKEQRPLSLSYLISENQNEVSSLTISSEPLDGQNGLWREVPTNSYLYLSKTNMHIEIGSL